MKLSMSSRSSSSSRPPTPFSSSQMREISFVRDLVGPRMSRSSSEDSTMDLRLDVDAVGGEPESRPRLKRVNLFLLRAKVSPVFSSRSSRSSSSRTSSSSRAYRQGSPCQACISMKSNHTDLADDDAVYVFYASASSHPRRPEPLPRPHPRLQ